MTASARRPQPPPALVGDIGGTSARFALAGPRGALAAHGTLATADHPDLAAAVRAYLATTGGPPPRRAAIAIASPVTGDEVRFTNLDWAFSTAALRRELGLEQLAVINDFTALALSLPALAAEGSEELKPGEPVAGAPLALIGPGTGLGVGGLVPIPPVPESRSRWVPLASEGGHRDLAASSEREWAVVRILRRRFGHVSAERAVSGPGLVTLYEACCELDGLQPEALDPAGVVARGRHGVARAAAHPAREALELFTGWLGAVAGDLALTLGARGGVFVGGGVVPAMGDAFDRRLFVARFFDKGRFRGYLEAVPVRLITAPDAALRGAARAL